MPLQLKHIQGRSRNLKVQYAGEVVAVTYKPGVLTSNFMASIKDGDRLGTAKLLNSTLVEWDIMDGDKQVPITVETLADFPLDLLKAIADQLMEDMVPGEA